MIITQAQSIADAEAELERVKGEAKHWEDLWNDAFSKWDKVAKERSEAESRIRDLEEGLRNIFKCRPMHVELRGERPNSECGVCEAERLLGERSKA